MRNSCLNWKTENGYNELAKCSVEENLNIFGIY